MTAPETLGARPLTQPYRDFPQKEPAIVGRNWTNMPSQFVTCAGTQKSTHLHQLQADDAPGLLQCIFLMQNPGMLEPARKRLSKKAKRGFRGWPLATVAFYGPDDTRATKLAVGIVPSEGAEATELRRWFSKE